MFPAYGFDKDYSTVFVKQVTNQEWELCERLVYRTPTDTFMAGPPMRTDFASVPRVFVWLLPRYGPYTKAAILHDYLWRTVVPVGKISRTEADRVFREAMHELNVAFLRRWIMWAAVRWASLFKSGGREGWLKDLWCIILVSLFALAIVALPALAILASLLVFYIIEILFYLPLLLTRLIKAYGMPRSAVEKVNQPSFLLNM